MALDGLFDRRRMDVAEKILRLYQEEYWDFNVKHFHEELLTKHEVNLDKDVAPRSWFG
jgi:hypothetical protein